MVTDWRPVLPTDMDMTNRALWLDLEKAARGEDWIAPALVNSWANFGGAQTPAGYRLDIMGWVHLRGLVAAGTTATVAFTLPANYRPEYPTINATIDAAPGPARCDIGTNGDVTLYYTNTTWITLSNIAFRAFQ